MNSHKRLAFALEGHAVCFQHMRNVSSTEWVALYDAGPHAYWLLRDADGVLGAFLAKVRGELVGRRLKVRWVLPAGSRGPTVRQAVELGGHITQLLGVLWKLQAESPPTTPTTPASVLLDSLGLSD